jgi:hypothetical protein
MNQQPNIYRSLSILHGPHIAVKHKFEKTKKATDFTDYIGLDRITGCIGISGPETTTIMNNQWHVGWDLPRSTGSGQALSVAEWVAPP